MQEKADKYFKAGSFLYIEGEEESDSIYIIKKGQVKFIRSSSKIAKKKKKAKSGDIIGSISAFCNRPRIESAVAESDVIVSEIFKENFLSLLQKNYQIAFKILNNFAIELDTYNNLLITKNGNKSAFENETRLFKLSEYYYNKNINIAGYTLNKYLKLYPRGKFKKEINQTDIDFLTKKLTDANPRTRLNAIYRLAQLGSQADTAISDLKKLLQDTSEQIRTESIGAISKILPKENAFQLFTEYSNDKLPEIRSCGALGLGEVQPFNNKEATLLLIKLLTDDFAIVKSNALHSLINVGSAALEAVPSLIDKLSDKDKKIILLSIKALKNIARNNIYTGVTRIALKRLKKTSNDSLIKKESKNALKTLKKKIKN